MCGGNKKAKIQASASRVVERKQVWMEVVKKWNIRKAKSLLQDIDAAAR